MFFLGHSRYDTVMKNLPHHLYSAAQTRELDRLLIEQTQTPGIVLMERAGSAAFELLRQRWPEAQRLAVFCGGGNNGGDGFVVARLAQRAGLAVTLYLLADPARLSGEAQQAFQSLNLSTITFHRQLTDEPLEFDLLVDGLLGTGLNTPVGGLYAEAIAQINSSEIDVLALDVPSGLDASSGAVLGCAVRAAVTISFIGLNRGLLTGQGPGYCGEVSFADLGCPDEIYQQIAQPTQRIDYQTLKHLLKPRPADAHKGMCGHLLLVGGEQGMSGAIRIAAEAALRCGAGLVSVATRAQHADQLTSQRPEIMSHGVEDLVTLRPLLERALVIVCGPGLGRSAWGKMMLDEVLKQSKPLVLDADALNLLAAEPQQRDSWLLTPHPAEAARLLGVATNEVQADRFKAVAELQQRYGGFVLLKGAGTLMCGPDGDVMLCSDGNPGMASGGMGDLLSGVMGALLAQGMPLAQALTFGVALHGIAGDYAAGDHPRGLLASDLLPCLRELVNP